MTSFSRRARIAGLCYVAMIAVGLIRLLYIPSKLFVKGDAAATAANIAAHQSLFRLGMAASVVGIVMFLFLGFVLYRLLSGVDNSLASAMVIFVIISTAIECVNVLTDAAALQLIRGADYLSIFDKPQREALARLSLDLHFQCFVVDEIFWGLWLLPLGLLVIRSGFLPRLLGVWLILGGVGWMLVCLTGLLEPEYYDRAYRFTSPIRLGEIAFLLWLLIMGAKDKGTIIPDNSGRLNPDLQLSPDNSRQLNPGPPVVRGNPRQLNPDPLVVRGNLRQLIRPRHFVSKFPPELSR